MIYIRTLTFLLSSDPQKHFWQLQDLMCRQELYLELKEWDTVPTLECVQLFSIANRLPHIMASIAAFRIGEKAEESRRNHANGDRGFCKSPGRDSEGGSGVRRTYIALRDVLVHPLSMVVFGGIAVSRRKEEAEEKDYEQILIAFYLYVFHRKSTPGASSTFVDAPSWSSRAKHMPRSHSFEGSRSQILEETGQQLARHVFSAFKLCFPDRLFIELPYNKFRC
jgi:hypothetical protein